MGAFIAVGGGHKAGSDSPTSPSQTQTIPLEQPMALAHRVLTGRVASSCSWTRTGVATPEGPPTLLPPQHPNKLSIPGNGLIC